MLRAKKTPAKAGPRQRREKKRAAPKKAKRKIVRAVKKKAAKKRRAAPAKRAAKSRPVPAGMEKIGDVTHYFPKVRAAAVLILKDSLKLGDDICIKGHTTDFKEAVTSMQLDRVPIEEGKKGQEIGLLVKSRTRIGDSVYRIKK